MRVERIIQQQDAIALDAVFTGRLVDADGTSIGVGSRRQQVPAAVLPSPDGAQLSVGPLQVDILGLTVSVPAFTVAADGSTTTPGDAKPQGDR